MNSLACLHGNLRSRDLIQRIINITGELFRCKTNLCFSGLYSHGSLYIDCFLGLRKALIRVFFAVTLIFSQVFKGRHGSFGAVSGATCLQWAGQLLLNDKTKGLGAGWGKEDRSKLPEGSRGYREHLLLHNPRHTWHSAELGERVWRET